MPKFLIIIIILVILGLLVWFFCFPKAQVVRLVECPGAANDEPKLESRDTEIFVRWYHLCGTKVKFKNDSKFDGVQIQMPCTDFFKNPPTDLDFTLAIGESKTLTLKNNLPSGKQCQFQVNPFCELPGPRLIKRP